MQFMLIICHDEFFTPTDSLFTDISGWIEEMKSRGIRQYGNPLRPPADAMTVRVRDGRNVITEGPFESSKEKICAYELIECASLDEAVKAAAEHPMARVATIEVRPVWAELT